MYLISWINTALLAQITCLIVICYVFGLGIYRLYLSPIAHVPGPLLARLTYWYETYYDVGQGGQYSFKIRELHRQYGPIIRINPDEVHFHDPDFYDEVYAGYKKKRNKWSWQMDAFDIKTSIFGTAEHDLHKTRRAPLNSFFSSAKVRALQPRIDVVVDKLLERLEDFKKSGKAFRIDHAFGCLTSDVAMEYAFGRNYNRIEHPDFDPEFNETSYANTRPFHLLQHFPFIGTFMSKCLPEKTLRTLSPDMAMFLDFQKDVQKMAREVRSTAATSTKPDKTTVLHDVMNSNAAASEKTYEYMWQNGQLIIIAGTITTSANLATMMFHILNQPEQLKTLRKELFEAIPNPNDPISLVTLEKLPYLNAVVREGLRLANGVATRLARIDPEKPTTYIDRHTGPNEKSYIIPPGTPMSLTSMLIHQDPKIYPDPMSFIPERWLTDHPPAEKYFHPFTKGSRSCLGINLAYAELYLTLAKIFRSYGSVGSRMKGDKGCLELFETTEKDIEIVADFFVPFSSASSKGVRIAVKE